MDITCFSRSALRGQSRRSAASKAALAAFGFTILDVLYVAAGDSGYSRVDTNNEGVLCAKPFPSQSNKPAYLANSVDNATQSEQCLIRRSFRRLWSVPASEEVEIP